MTTNASTAVIRQWARAEGLTVGDRGRLSPGVLAAYEARHRGVPRPATNAGAATGPSAPVQRATPNGRLRIAARPAPGADVAGRRVTARPS